MLSPRSQSVAHRPVPLRRSPRLPESFSEADLTELIRKVYGTASLLSPQRAQDDINLCLIHTALGWGSQRAVEGDALSRASTYTTLSHSPARRSCAQSSEMEHEDGSFQRQLPPPLIPLRSAAAAPDASSLEPYPKRQAAGERRLAGAMWKTDAHQSPC